MGTFFVLLIVLAVIAAAAASVIRDKKQGKCSCGEDSGARTICGSCTGCGRCTDGRGTRKQQAVKQDAGEKPHQ